ncbi:LysR family transcriptional regulator [Bdellovibrio bacteriovorus]|uniref:LysR family transcriptional regulator n=1 Tax=Bdellovibrio bacteriovorus TaxID=959 RepID=A0A1Z3ND24_BDEBC|nr:LysR family transcriptional regulator [Bdellovibrio bacteriovorus]ASD65362.1 LysR family transcriptional regulator [Bdellovibrio bacteriovorus]
MNLDQLEFIKAVIECGSFRAAADRVGRSQPALSVAIKNLEDELGLQIFDRSEYKVKLTPEGQAFYAVAKNTLESAQYTTRVGIELGRQKADTELHISADPLISTEVLEIIALECARPTLPVNLIFSKSILQGGYERLLEGEIDLAIAPSPKNSEDLESIFLEDVTLVAAVSRRLLQEKRSPTKDFLMKHPQILVYNSQIKPSKEPGHKIYVPDHHTKVKMIEGGVGWGRIAKSECTKEKNLVLIDKSIASETHLELCLVRPKNRPIGVTARSVWNAFQKRSTQGR